MNITGIVWLRDIVDKLLWKHNVTIDDMERIKNSKKRDPIPKHFTSIDEAAEFWDTHDLADYWDLTREANFEVDIQHRVFSTTLEPELAKKLVACARKRGVSTETLINVWLTEKLTAATQSQ